jgi:hypothetical protein
LKVYLTGVECKTTLRRPRIVCVLPVPGVSHEQPAYINQNSRMNTSKICRVKTNQNLVQIS